MSKSGRGLSTPQGAVDAARVAVPAAAVAEPRDAITLPGVIWSVLRPQGGQARSTTRGGGAAAGVRVPLTPSGN